MTNRTPSLIAKILEYDVRLTKETLKHVLQYPSFKTFRDNGKFLEMSCNGIVWLAIWLAFIWIINSPDYYQMQLNMMFGLILDIIIIALMKAYFRRRRPERCADMLTIGPDKFSFPSGHASRSTYILLFFTTLYPLSMIWWLPIAAWFVSVCLSRLVMQRHYILDITIGILVGIFEILILKILWVNKETAINIINYLSNDSLPGPME